MSKNTVLAILMIIIAVTVFNSQTYNKFFYENIYPRKPYIVKKQEPQKKKDTTKPFEKEKSDSSKITEQNQVEKNEIDSTKADTTKNDNVNKDTVWIETDKMILGIEEKGAIIVSAKMKSYKYYDEKNEKRKKGELIDILPVDSKNGAQLKINGRSYDNDIFTVEMENKKIKVEGNEEKYITFRSTNNDSVKKIFIIKNGTYKVGLQISNKIIGKKVEIGWNGGIEESEKAKAMQPEIRTAHYSDGENSQHIQMNKEESDTITGNYRWVGISSKYFFVSIVSDKEKDADIVINSFRQKNEMINKKDNALNYSISISTISDENTEGFWFFIGPNDYNELKKYKLSFDNNLFPVFGWTKYIFFADKWFPAICEAVLWLLLVLYGFVKDYGIAIFLLTLLTKLVTYPMTHSSMKSMNRMRDIQPKIQALRDKHKNNAKKMNEELMNLYRKEGINPLNPGCLPIFLQMPIFIALFVVLRKAIELRGAETILLPWVQDLSKAEVLIQLPYSIPLYGSNVALLPIIMAILTYFQNKMTIKDPNQKAMIYFMPVFMLVLFNSFSAGLVLYWTLSSAFGIVQQIITDRTINKPKQNVTKK